MWLVEHLAEGCGSLVAVPGTALHMPLHGRPSGMWGGVCAPQFIIKMHLFGCTELKRGSLVRALVWVLLFKFYFSITVYVQHYSVFVLGVQHSGQTTIHFTE